MVAHAEINHFARGVGLRRAALCVAALQLAGKVALLGTIQYQFASVGHYGRSITTVVGAWYKVAVGGVGYNTTVCERNECVSS